MESVPDYTLTIPDTPPSDNKFSGPRGRFAKSDAVEGFGWEIWGAMNDVDCPCDIASRRKVRVQITFPKPARRDQANFCKVLQDAMKFARLIVDDSPKWLDFELPTLRYVRGVRETKIEVWEVGDDKGLGI